MSAHSAIAKFAFTEDALCCILFNRFVFCLTSEAVCSSLSWIFFFCFNNLQVTHDVIYKALGKLVCRKWFKRTLFPAGHLIHFHRQWFSICNIQFSLWTAQFFHSGRLFVRSFVRSVVYSNRAWHWRIDSYAKVNIQKATSISLFKFPLECMPFWFLFRSLHLGTRDSLRAEYWNTQTHQCSGAKHILMKPNK